MSVWLINLLIIETMALIGVIGVLVTKRTGVAFAAGFNTMLLVTLVYILKFPPMNARKLIVISMVLIYLLHMNWLLLLKSRNTAIPKLDRKLTPAQKYLMPILLTNTVGWGYSLPFYFAARRTDPMGITDIIAVLVYIVGTIIHFGSDYQKYRFKSRPESKGKLLKTGFWGLCRHPNYFGDFLIYLSFALIGGTIWSWIAPILNLMQYIFDAIPKNERWAKEHYGREWDQYASKVKKFIPYVY